MHERSPPQQAKPIALAVPVVPSIPAPRPQSRWQPRAVWLALHCVGLGLLHLSRGWPASGPARTWFSSVVIRAAILYAAASFRNPGYAATAAMTAARLARRPGELEEALVDQVDSLVTRT